MLRKLLIYLVTFMIIASTAFAEEQKKEEPKKEEVFTKGVISSTVVGQGNKNVTAQGISDSPGDVQSVIAGSVSYAKGDICKAMIRNNSKENTYAVNFAVIAKDDNGSQLFRRASAATLKPGKAVTQDFSGCPKEAVLQLVITSGHKL